VESTSPNCSIVALCNLQLQHVGSSSWPTCLVDWTEQAFASASQLRLANCDRGKGHFVRRCSS
ncbi:hypothetical protein F443_00698, partial [Phytophthora nicotianae P1569]